MVSGRPLLYLSLPSLAIIIGLVWFRRKKFIGFDSGGKTPADENSECVEKADKSIHGEEECHAIDLKHTESLPINPSPNDKDESSKNQSSSSSSSCSGKSAPIDIVSNTRSPPKFSDQQLDAELLKLKIEESDIRNLRLIEEQDDFSSFESPVNLPGTVDRFQNFNKFDKSFEPQMEPVVVKAKSPESCNGTSDEDAHTQDMVNNNSVQEEAVEHVAESVRATHNEDAVNNNMLNEGRRDHFTGGPKCPTFKQAMSGKSQWR